MCLIVHQPKEFIMSDELLSDIYRRNSDGLGLMYAQDGELVVRKFLPKSAAEFVQAYREHGEGRELVLHARMTTHGETDMENCHPYQVTPGVALMHNGVLSMGNVWDKTKSDTWHFVQRVIAPAVAYDPALILDPSWQGYMSAIIGSGNRFALMDRHGQVVIINRAQGVEFMGCWFSNTYAWPCRDYGLETPGYYPTSRSYASSVYDWESGQPWDKWRASLGGSSSYGTSSSSSTSGSSSTAPIVSTTTTRRGKLQVKAKGASPTMLQVWRAARNSYARDRLLDWVHAAPEKAQAFLVAIKAGETLGVSVRDLALTDPSSAALIIENYFDTDGTLPVDAQVRT